MRRGVRLSSTAPWLTMSLFSQQPVVDRVKLARLSLLKLNHGGPEWTLFGFLLWQPEAAFSAFVENWKPDWSETSCVMQGLPHLKVYLTGSQAQIPSHVKHFALCVDAKCSAFQKPTRHRGPICNVWFYKCFVIWDVIYGWEGLKFEYVWI